MAYFMNSTQVITNSPTINWGFVVSQPSGLITALSVTTTGDGTNPRGGSTGRVNDVQFAGGVLTLNYDTNCTVACACACACACGS